MSDQFPMDLSTAAPQNTFSPPEQALWWLAKGSLSLGPEWERAHDICQSAEGDPVHDWIHALCHLIEDDPGNAAYWFRRAGKPVEGDAERLWREIAGTV
ncbi:hypothetical protein [Roseibium sp.]|uniref:hypothetical protein n=1 Tax=Roseibium sp. TaxID=1936156 RepID=UPI0032636EFC